MSTAQTPAPKVASDQVQLPVSSAILYANATRGGKRASWYVCKARSTLALATAGHPHRSCTPAARGAAAEEPGPLRVPPQPQGAR